MADVLAIFMVFSVPLAGIASFTYLRARKLASGSFSQKDKQLIQQLLDENQELRRRLENVEEIVTDPDLMRLRYLETNKLPGK